MSKLEIDHWLHQEIGLGIISGLLLELDLNSKVPHRTPRNIKCTWVNCATVNLKRSHYGANLSYLISQLSKFRKFKMLLVNFATLLSEQNTKCHTEREWKRQRNMEGGQFLFKIVPFNKWWILIKYYLINDSICGIETVLITFTCSKALAYFLVRN
jgi:hypothetical protein